MKLPPLRDVDISLLRTFVAVVEAGGMTRAAIVQNLTQAAVSQQIKRLEELFDQKFFDRSQKQLKLTGDGEKLLAFARRMIKLNDEVWTSMTAPAFEGEVNMGVPHDIFKPFMPSILRSFGNAWPRTNLILHSDPTITLLEKLNDGVLDVVLTTEDRPQKNLMMADPLVWAGMRGGQAWRLNPLPVALGHELCAFRAAALQALSERGIDWKLSCHVGSHDPIIAILEADLGVAPFLSGTVPDNLEIIGEEARLPMLPHFYINLHVKPGQNNPAVEALVELIRQGFAGRFDNAA